MLRPRVDVFAQKSYAQRIIRVAPGFCVIGKDIDRQRENNKKEGSRFLSKPESDRFEQTKKAVA